MRLTEKELELLKSELEWYKTTEKPIVDLANRKMCFLDKVPSNYDRLIEEIEFLRSQKPKRKKGV